MMDFEAIMDHAYEALGEMVAEGSLAADERARIGVLPRRRRDLLALFEHSERYCNLTVEYIARPSSFQTQLGLTMSGIETRKLLCISTRAFTAESSRLA
jgi:hypothetical protein